LHIFHHLAQKSLDIRQYACRISIQSGEKSDSAASAQAMCGDALTAGQESHPALMILLLYHSNKLLSIPFIGHGMIFSDKGEKTAKDGKLSVLPVCQKS